MNSCSPLNAILILGLLHPCYAADYYVDAKTGNDAKGGTADAPFKTLRKGAGLAQAGDTIHVMPGIYREGIRLRNSGTAGRPIRFVADKLGSVIVTGADIITGWERVAGDEPIYKVPWTARQIVNVKDGKPVEHHPASTPLWGRTEQVIVDGKQLKPCPSLADLRAAWREHSSAAKQGKFSRALSPPLPNLGPAFAGMFAADTVDKKELYLWLTTGQPPTDEVVEASTRGLVFGVNPWQNKKGVEHVHVKKIVFRYGASFSQRGGVWLHGKNNVIEECVIEEMAGGGVSVAGQLRRSIIRNNGHIGGTAHGNGFVNEENLWEGNSWKPIPRIWEAGGVKITRANGGIYRRCLFRRNGGPGLWLDINVQNVQITECVFQENEGSGLFIEISRDIKATNNLAIRNAVGAVGSSKLGWSNAGIKVAESYNVILENNTCIMNKDGITFREQGPRPLKTPDGEIQFYLHHNRIARNLCAGNQGHQLGIWYDNSFFGWHPSEKNRYKDEAEWRAALKGSKRVDYDPLKQSHEINQNLYIYEPNTQPFLYGCPWRPKSQRFANLKDYVAFTGFDKQSRSDAAKMPDDPMLILRLAKKTARAQKTGWASAPLDIDAWSRTFLPEASGSLLGIYRGDKAPLR